MTATLKRRECDLKDAPVLRRMGAATFLANKLSHDSSLLLVAGDLKALWADIGEFEQLVVCGECSSMITTKYVDASAGTISCKCGVLKYNWRT